MKKIKSRQRQIGAALLITILLAGAISLIAFGMTKITLNEIFVGSKSEEGLEAYYAAQAGVEDALMRYKFHDKTDLEIPNGASKDSNAVLRVYIDKPSNDSSKVERVVNPRNNAPSVGDNGVLHYVYDLKVWSKQNCPDQDGNPCQWSIDKDKSILLDVSDTNLLFISWQVYDKADKIVTLNSGSPSYQDEIKKTGLWYRLADNPTNPTAVDPTDQNRDFFTFFNQYAGDPTATDPILGPIPQIRIPRGMGGGTISTRGAHLLKLKAFISDTLNGQPAPGTKIKLTITIPSDKQIGGPKTYIESTGYFGDTAKKIEVTVDRESKSIIDVFDYVIYSGHGPLPR